MFRSTWLALAVLLVVSPVAAQDWARKMFVETTHDFGSVGRGAKAEHRFEFTNQYVEDVHIASARSSCGCTSVSIEKPTVKSHEKGAIVATFNTKSFTGRRGATLTVTIDKPYRAEIQLHVNGVILGDLSVEPGSVQLGTVDQGTPAETKITVSRSGRSDWKIVDVRCANTALTCEPVETRRSAGQVSYQLLVRLRGDAPAGYINDHLILVTNDRQASQVPVAVSGAVRPSLSVSPASLFLGTVRAGETVTRQFVVKGTRPFRILSIDCGDARFEFDTTGADQPRPLHLVPVKFTADADIGELSRTIRVKTDLGDAAPRLSAVAVIHSAGE